MLHEQLSELATRYVYERAKKFAQSEFADFVRHDLAIEAKKQIVFLRHELKVKASVGAGNWAAVPWLAYFDPLITESATRGFYVVYLINAQTEEIFLSLNQGTTAAYESFGEKKGKDYLRRNALEIMERIPEFTKLFDTDPIFLGSEESLPAGYAAGHAFGRCYNSRKIDQERFYSDLEIMLSAYSALVERGGTTPTESMMEQAESLSVEESRRYVLSRRIERASNVRLPVLQKRGAVCEGCGLNPKDQYGFEGPLKKTPLDVHHSKPIRELAEGETRRYSIPGDFLVLCPTCHRVIHKQKDPSDLEVLKASIKFQH